MYVKVIARQIVTFWSTVYLAHITICLLCTRQRMTPRDAVRRTLCCVPLRCGPRPGVNAALVI